MLKYSLEQVTGRMICGEGLHWDSTRKCMYLCDINGSMVFRYVPKTKELFQAKVDVPYVSLIIPVKGTTDKFVVGVGHCLAVMKWDGVSPNVPKSDLQVLDTVELDKPRNRFNDGKCDPTGRVVAGTMGGLVNGVWDQKAGNFYSLGKGGKLRVLFDEVGISNGLCWSHDGKTFYYADSLKYTVDAFDYNCETGDVSNRRVVFSLRENGLEGIPDGMTIDSNGNLWVANYGGSCVFCVDPKTKKLLQRVPIPGKYTTCVQFGGENLDEMYVSTATVETSMEEIRISPYLGGTFIVTGLGVKGCGSVPAVLQ